jgi:DNA-binding GntR family transcriptional regulator
VDHEEHLRILEAIRSGDAGRAEELMKRHLSGVRSLIADRFEAWKERDHEAT